MNKQILTYDLNRNEERPYYRGIWEFVNDIKKENLKGKTKTLFHNIVDCNSLPDVLKFVVFDWENLKVLVYREPEIKIYSFESYNEVLKALKKNESYFIKEGLKDDNDNLKKIMLFKDIDKYKIKEIVKGNTKIRIGDFLSTCWGYDQTNVELFVIKKIIGKNYFIIQEVSQQTDNDNKLMYDMVKVSDSVIKIDIPKKAFISNDGYMSICEGGYKRHLSLTDINKYHYKTNSQFGH